MRIIFTTANGPVREGDILDTVDNNRLHGPVTVTAVEVDHIRATTPDGFRSRIYGGDVEYYLGDSVRIITLPEVGYFNRITGHPLAVGDTVNGGTIAGVHDDILFVRPPEGEVMVVEVDPSIENLEAGIEIRVAPSETELSMGLPRILRNGKHWVQTPDGDIPADESVWLDGRYRRVAQCHILRGLEQRLITNTGGCLRLPCGRWAYERECVRLTAGARTGNTVHFMDAAPTMDQQVVLRTEARSVRDGAGTPLLYYRLPDGVVELDGQYCYEWDLVEDIVNGGTLHVSDTVEIPEGRVSRLWAEDNCRYCYECSRWFIPEDGECECQRCREGARTRIRNYSNQTACDLRPERGVPIKFGIELEVGCDRGFSQDRCAEVMADALDSSGTPITEYAVFKHDGSLADCNGFEIVTRPDCPSVHKRIWEVALSDPKVPRHMSSFNNGKCGIHIHVSRAPLSELWVGRLLVLVNDPANRALMRTIAGRNGNTYTVYDDNKKLRHGRWGCSLSRYESLNTGRRNTIEFRMFRGTLYKSSFLKNIEFVQAALEFTRPAARSLRDVNQPSAFLDFVSKSRKDYPNLFQFLVNKQLCKK